MSRQDLTEILDICLQRMQAGSTLEEAIAAFPQHKEDLRVLLLIALDALPSTRETRVSASGQVNSRRQFLARAQQMRSQPGSAGLWGLLRFARANVGSLAFALSAILLLVLGLNSAQALPGDGLYPVKLAAEQAGVELAPSTTEREQRASAFDSRRAEEVAQMIQMQRTGPVEFGGFLRQSAGGQWSVADIRLRATESLAAQTRGLAGVYVEVKGELDAQGEVTARALQPRLEPLAGVIEQVRDDGWLVDGQWVRVNATSRISGAAGVGGSVTIQAARIENSSDLLAIYAEVSGGVQPSATPEATVTAAPTQTVTSTPTRQPSVTITPAPTRMLATPSADDTHATDDHGGDSHNDSGSNSGSGSDDHSDDKGSDDSGKDH